MAFPSEVDQLRHFYGVVFVICREANVRHPTPSSLDRLKSGIPEKIVQ
jgi:hypothetical protein